MTEKFTLKQIRQIKGMSQEKLADEVGVTSRTIANYESDVLKFQKADYMIVYKISKALGVKTSDIFLGIESEKPKLTI